MGCSGSKNAGAASAAAPVEKPQPVEGDFKITLERSDEKTLGLNVVAEDSVLRVQAVNEEGLVPDFMKANVNSPDLHIKAGDLIVAVNGVSGGTDKLMDELKTQTIVLTVKRAPPAAATTEGENVAPAENVEPAAEPDASSAKPAVPAPVEPVLNNTERASAAPQVAQESTEVEVDALQGEQDAQGENAAEARLCKMSIC